MQLVTKKLHILVGSIERNVYPFRSNVLLHVHPVVRGRVELGLAAPQPNHADRLVPVHIAVQQSGVSLFYGDEPRGGGEVRRG